MSRRTLPLAVGGAVASTAIAAAGLLPSTAAGPGTGSTGGPLPSAAAPAAGPASSPTAARHRPPALLITDATAPRATVVATDQRRVVGTFDLASRGSAYAGERYGFVVQADGGTTSVVDAAARLPVLLGNQIRGDRPVHVAAHDGKVAVFHDDSGEAVVVDEARLGQVRPRMRTYETGREHHGVAVPLGRLVLLSMPDPADEEDELPVGVEVRTQGDRTVSRLRECPGLHGEAPLGDLVAFGCDDGVLVVEGHGDHVHWRKVAEPAAGAERRVGTVRAAEGVPYLVGGWGSDALVRIDPEGEELVPIPLGLTVRSFALHPHDGGTVVVLTTDGSVHTVDGETGEVLQSLRVVPAFGTTGARPSLAIGDTAAWVTDPRSGRVTEVRLPDLRVEARIAVGGSPQSVAVVRR